MTEWLASDFIALSPRSPCSLSSSDGMSQSGENIFHKEQRLTTSAMADRFSLMARKLEIWISILLGLAGMALLLQSGPVVGFLSRFNSQPGAASAAAGVDPLAAISALDAWSMSEGEVDEPFQFDERLKSGEIQIVRGNLPEAVDQLVVYIIPDRLCSVDALNEIDDLASALKEVNPKMPSLTLVLESDPDRARHLADTLKLTGIMGVAKRGAVGSLGRFGTEYVPQQMLLVDAGQGSIRYRRVLGGNQSSPPKQKIGTGFFHQLLSSLK